MFQILLVEDDNNLRKLYRTNKVEPLLETRYEEIYAICDKGKNYCNK